MGPPAASFHRLALATQDFGLAPGAVGLRDYENPRGLILVTADGVPKLLDFGIAKVLVADPDAEDTTTATTPTADLASTLTRPGVRVLTPEYSSPEQIAGRPLTTATDVYSLGVLLYLLISGQRYLHGTSELTEEQKQPAERLFREAIDVAHKVFGSPSPLEADC